MKTRTLIILGFSILYSMLNSCTPENELNVDLPRKTGNYSVALNEESYERLTLGTFSFVQEKMRLKPDLVLNETLIKSYANERWNLLSVQEKNDCIAVLKLPATKFRNGRDSYLTFIKKIGDELQPFVFDKDKSLFSKEVENILASDEFLALTFEQQQDFRIRMRICEELRTAFVNQIYNSGFRSPGDRMIWSKAVEGMSPKQREEGAKIVLNSIFAVGNAMLGNIKGAVSNIGSMVEGAYEYIKDATTPSNDNNNNNNNNKGNKGNKGNN